ncbi:MAG: hypothetical protein JXB19_01500, partial [Bacteroidales bacterium]|nr:hypothetical protein [Bacteroidales bacterium]
TGSVVVILSFTWDFCSYFLPLVRESDITGIHLIHPLTYGYIPDQFNWFLYIAGEIVILTGIINIWLRYRRPGTDRSSKGAVRL